MKIKWAFGEASVIRNLPWLTIAELYGGNNPSALYAALVFCGPLQGEL